jgi:hypothetical protein
MLDHVPGPGFCPIISVVPCHQCTTFSTAVRDCGSGFKGPTALYSKHNNESHYVVSVPHTTFVLHPSGLRHNKIFYTITKGFADSAVAIVMITLITIYVGRRHHAPNHTIHMLTTFKILLFILQVTYTCCVMRVS